MTLTKEELAEIVAKTAVLESQVRLNDALAAEAETRSRHIEQSITK